MLQVSNTNFTGNSGTNGGAIAMQSTTNATFSGITAAGNSAGCGGGMFVDRAASIQVTHHKSYFFRISSSLSQVEYSALAAHHAFANPRALFAEHDVQAHCTASHNFTGHTPSLQLQPSEVSHRSHCTVVYTLLASAEAHVISCWQLCCC